MVGGDEQMKHDKLMKRWGEGTANPSALPVSPFDYVGNVTKRKEEKTCTYPIQCGASLGDCM